MLVDELARMYRQYVLYSRSATAHGTIIDSAAAPRHAPVVTSTEHCSMRNIVNCDEIITPDG